MPSPHLDNDAINLLRNKLDIVFNRSAFDILIDSNGNDEVVRQLLILKQKFRNGIDKGFIPQTFRSTDYTNWFALTIVDPRSSLHGCTLRFKPSPGTTIDEKDSERIADALWILMNDAKYEPDSFIADMMALRNK